jgi:hypothetical protein
VAIWPKLRRRIKDELGYECEETFHRTYVGRNQKAEGAWVWYAQAGIMTVGSQWTMTELLKAPYLSSSKEFYLDVSIYPEKQKLEQDYV